MQRTVILEKQETNSVSTKLPKLTVWMVETNPCVYQLGWKPQKSLDVWYSTQNNLGSVENKIIPKLNTTLVPPNQNS